MGPTAGTPVVFTFASTNPTSTGVTLPSAATINGQPVSKQFTSSPGLYSLTYTTDDAHVDWPWTGFNLSVVLQTTSPVVQYTAAAEVYPTFALWHAGVVPSSLSSLNKPYWLSSGGGGVYGSGSSSSGALVLSLGGGVLRLYRVSVVSSGAADYVPSSLVVTDVTSAAGLPGVAATSVAAGDIDNDGDDDLLLVLGSSVGVLVNNGSGYYLDQSSTRGVTATSCSGVALFDANGDGWLDVLVVAAVSKTALFMNAGAGVFVDDTTARLQTSTTGDYVSANAFDADGDGDVDVFLVGGVNYYNVLLVNDGSGHFVNGAVARGVAGDLHSVYTATVADLNRCVWGVCALFGCLIACMALRLVHLLGCMALRLHVACLHR